MYNMYCIYMYFYASTYVAYADERSILFFTALLVTNKNIAEGSVTEILEAIAYQDGDQQ